MQELNLGIYLSRDHIISYNIAVWSVSSQSTLWVADLSLRWAHMQSCKNAVTYLI